MSDALFLPRELFAPHAQAAAAQPAVPAVPPRRGVQFDSGEAVAADLLRTLGPVDRRRQPRAANARGVVDLYIG
ncbi:hypothetical protein ACVNIS_02840 [Sphaerotilaceae bacterium SBD11-9]